mmetsp:Transcript_3529/g.7134  ORF Transcript_3529/g.7134 Transcript_3529/m.7134 type:complete len:242 (-) Transcript_3529:141-866(-)
MPTARSSSPVVTSLLLVALGVALGLLVAKAPELLKKAESPGAAPVPAVASSPGPLTHADNLNKKVGFLQNPRFTGSFGSGGWKGAAVVEDERGSSLKLGTTISGRGIEEIEATAGYKSQDWELPDVDLKAAVVPGTSGIKYSAKMSKTMHVGPEPKLVAEVSNKGLSVGATLNRALMPGVDTTMDVRMPLSNGGADLVVDTKTTYKMGNGQVVGTLGGKASTGLKGVNYGMDFDMAYDVGA